VVEDGKERNGLYDKIWRLYWSNDDGFGSGNFEFQIVEYGKAFTINKNDFKSAVQSSGMQL
jgi:hypothetical protein